MSPELSSQHNSSSRLHWKDEFDGDICSAVVEDSDMINSPAKQSGAKGAMERQGSSTALKRSESGKMTTFVSVHVARIVCNYHYSNINCICMFRTPSREYFRIQIEGTAPTATLT